MLGNFEQANKPSSVSNTCVVCLTNAASALYLMKKLVIVCEM